ncbi:hypothetical protein H1P_4050002 [Hyella patelloides LEGE 07179]|uniref:Uncharacterized protein n=1 Tax=Hyella patelloides LEGE 07179 TaxID=945734 RepID=A0A563VXG2_9CYAN|nr:hypothetical protein H1P_4050002 [Hyella patelloides LEGE 07179]
MSYFILFPSSKKGFEGVLWLGERNNFSVALALAKNCVVSITIILDFSLLESLLLGK